MDTTINMPLWLFTLLLVVTAWSLSSRILFPSVRWFLRRRVNRVLDEINNLLAIEIKPFQLTKRQVLIDRLVYDGKVIEAIHEHAFEEQIPREMAQAKVLNYAAEIVPAFNAYIYFRTGYWIAKKVARLFYRVRVGFVEEQAIASIDPQSTVVFVMNHRSNMDYILVSFLMAERTALSYAVGEWARVWALQTLIKATGAFFVRRNSRNKLYRRVLERYVHMATREGVCQAVFIEGGLSKDGRLCPPKLGFIDYILRGFDADRERDVVFVPIAVNYDRTLEDRTLLRLLDPHAVKKSKVFVVKTILGFVCHNLVLMARQRWQRFGFACVNFGIPVSARDYCRQHDINFSQLERTERFAQVEILAQRLLATIEQIIPVLPVSLLATLFVRNPCTRFSIVEIHVQVYQLLEHLIAQKVMISFPRKSEEYTIATALKMLHIRHLIDQRDDLYQVAPDSLEVLSYYANAIAHWFPPIIQKKENTFVVSADSHSILQNT